MPLPINEDNITYFTGLLVMLDNVHETPRTLFGMYLVTIKNLQLLLCFTKYILLLKMILNILE